MDFCLIAETASAGDWNAWYDWTISMLMVAAGLGFVIFVHELGHFLAAKSCGVKCEKFYIGFDIPLPKIAGFQLPSKLVHFQWGETEYGIGILPLGGYVKMLGQDDDPRKFKEEQERIKQAGGDATAMPVIDPRSYPAKTVPQRMLIISAGVIMNLIFGVIMGSVAYGMGVIYTPTVIGSISPGSAAWTSDYRPGDKVLRIGTNGRIDEHLRFNQDLMPQIMLNGGDTEMELLVRRDGKEIEMKAKPSDPNGIGAKLLGIGSSNAVIFEKEDPARPYTPVEKVKDQLAGAKIVAVNGEKITDYAQLQTILVQHPGEALKFTLEQPVTEGGQAAKETPATKTAEVEIAPQPRRSLGLVLQLGPVAAIKENSPAAKNGLFKPGDRLVSIAGQPVGDPFTLSQRLLAHVGQEIDVVVERDAESGKSAKDKKPEQLVLKITPTQPTVMERGLSGLPGEMIAAEPLGLAFTVLGDVVDVIKDSPADKAGIKAGDTIAGAQFVPASDEDRKTMIDKLRVTDKLFDQMTLEQSKRNWVTLHQWMQVVWPSTNVDITYHPKAGGVKHAKLAMVEMPDGFYESRGMNLQPLQDIRTASSVGDACWLGFRETKEKLVEVGRTLKRLVTGKISATNLGGPLSIFAVARQEASHGWPRLLIFLTFLSANLALLNFLPIPVLDGGHMVFLAAEWIRGKPVDENMQGWALLVGMVCLLSLMIFVFGLDIFRFIA